MKYQCSKCKIAVMVLPDQVIKGCKCDAPITANMTGNVEVKGGLSVGSKRK